MDLDIMYGIVIILFAIAGFYTLAVVLTRIYSWQSRRASSKTVDSHISGRGEVAEDSCYQDCVNRLGNSGKAECTWVCSAQFGT
jgi:hypothetical protein